MDIASRPIQRSVKNDIRHLCDKMVTGWRSSSDEDQYCGAKQIKTPVILTGLNSKVNFRLVSFQVV